MRGVAARLNESAIVLRDLSLSYPGCPALRQVTGRFEPGSMTAVVGPNGAGKSSLLAALMGRLRPSSGELAVPPGLSGRIVHLPQQVEIDRSFPVSVHDLVMLGHWTRLGPWRGARAEDHAAAGTALGEVGLAGLGSRPIAALSAGQFQRVLFARVLLQDAPVILLDEPFAAIDARTTADLLGLLARWHREQRTVVAVLHDLEQVRACFPRTLLLAREALAWGDTQDVLTAQNLDRARRMATSWDDPAAGSEGWRPGADAGPAAGSAA